MNPDRPDSPDEWFNQPPVPLEQLHQQALKNQDYAVAMLAQLPEKTAKPLREELEAFLKELDLAYQAKDASAHYQLDQRFFFGYLTNLNFALQAER